MSAHLLLRDQFLVEVSSCFVESLWQWERNLAAVLLLVLTLNFTKPQEVVGEGGTLAALTFEKFFEAA